MLYHQFKVVLRLLWRAKGFSLVNFAGLSIGLACCFVIALFISNEWQYDRSHEQFEDIYRVTTFEEDGNLQHVAHAYSPLAPLIDAHIDEVRTTVRIMPASVSINEETHNTTYQESALIFADSTFFDLFTHDFVDGQPGTALAKPNSVVLTARAAQRLFGAQSPMGKTLMLESATPYRVTGVISTPPENHSLQFEMVASMAGVEDVFGSFILASYAWYHPPMYTYVSIAPEDFSRVESGLPAFEKAHLPERINDQYDFRLQPFEDVHFESLHSDLSPAIKRSHLFLFLTIALLVLGIACANYVNLSLAHLVNRLSGYGMRKILGAENRHLLQSIALDSLVHLAAGTAGACILVTQLLPAFNRIMGKSLSLNSATPMLWAALGSVILLSVVMISVFLYFNLLKRNVIYLIKDQHQGSRTKYFALNWNRSFVVFQFVIAIGLIIATGVVQRQLQFIKHKDLGIRSEQLMIVPIRDEIVQTNYEATKNKLKQVPGVLSVTTISNFPWESGFYDFPSTISGLGEPIDANIPTLLVDNEFLETTKLNVLAGTSIDNLATTGKTTVFINETAATQYGIDALDGLQITISGITDDPISAEISAIVEDFHMKSLHHLVEPLVIAVTPKSASFFLDNFVIRTDASPIAGTLASLSGKWAELVPNRPFDYFFLDDAFDNLYQREARMSYLFNVFSLLAITIACLGLIALAAFNVEQRRREIGVRRVLGASAMGIVKMMSKDFLRLVFTAFIVATPISWLVMNSWLQEYAYRTSLVWWIFFGAGGIALIIAFIAVWIQTLRVAYSNPANALHAE